MAPVEIAGLGARTPLGLYAAPAAAAVRAGLSAAALHPFLIDQAGDRMTAAVDARLDPVLVGAQRMAILAESALREVCESLRDRGLSPLPVLLALPEERPGFNDRDAAFLRAALAQLERAPCVLGDVTVIARGHAGGLVALAAAAAAVARGDCDICVAGGVASYLHPDTMEWLDDRRQLVGSVSRSGFVPGEGAGFCLVTRSGVRERLRLPALARILGSGIAHENRPLFSQQTQLAEGLTAAVGQALERAGSGRIDNVYCDVNGARYRSEEWGFVSLRLGGAFADPAAYLSPAECWGDMDAASGPLLAVLACSAFARRYADGPNALLCAGSEAGLRAALVLGAPSAGPMAQ